MTPEPRDPKKLSEYLELDYFRRPSRFRRLWRVLPVAALVLGLGAVAAWALLPGQSVVYQAGPVSPPHAVFNQDCSQCHTDRFVVLNRFTSHDDAIRSVPDSACQVCHAGPPHQTGVAHEVACAVCHREHQGRAVLARVGDDQCLSCHRDLARAVVPDREVHFKSFGSWAQHPEFEPRWESHPKDPGTVRFNHKVHLNPEGLPLLDPNQARAQADAEKKPETKFKVLKCDDCHRMDEAGRYARPVLYEQHCKECHPLGVQVVSDLDTPAARAALEGFSRVPAPHREPLVVRSALRERLVEFIQQPGNEAFLKAKPNEESGRPIPGDRAKAHPVTEKEYAWVNDQLPKVEGGLFYGAGGCKYCHALKQEGKPAFPALPEYAESKINLRSFPLLGERAQWFPHSRFNHERHRMLLCAECHNAAGSEKTSDVLMPGIASCRNCHDNRPGASARGDCVECHTFHHADLAKPFQGKLTTQQVTGRPWDAARDSPHPDVPHPRPQP
jgi:predicted CXXCH cytochrome family protein